MRAILTSLFVIILAINGIACACPAGVDLAATPEQHASHGAETGSSAKTGDCHGSNCDNECDALDASKMQRQVQATSPLRLFDDADSDGNELLVSPDIPATCWRRTRSNAALSQQRTDTFLTTPVTLKDRMLD